MLVEGRCASRLTLILGLYLGLLAGTNACGRGQHYQDFSITRPLPARQFLILGFQGGRDRWDDDRQGVRQLALRLRRMQLPAQIETVENQKRRLALRIVQESLDRNQDGRLSRHEKQTARIILYGQSFGGAAVVKLARQLDRIAIPVLLTVQIDSVGRGDGRIPSNVRRALNLYQTDGWIIQGQARVRAEDPSRTKVTNRRFRYRGKPIDLSGVHWFKKLFRLAHTKMGLDPQVWQTVEAAILAELQAAL